MLSALIIVRDSKYLEFSASQLRIQFNTFQHNMQLLLQTTESTLCRHDTENLRNDSSMHELASRNCLFKHDWFARYVTDICF